MLVHTYMRMLHVHVSVHVRKIIHTCKMEHVRTYIRTCIGYMYVHVRVHAGYNCTMLKCMWLLYMYVHVCTCMYVCEHVRTYVCTCMYVCEHVCTYVCTCMYV